MLLFCSFKSVTDKLLWYHHAVSPQILLRVLENKPKPQRNPQRWCQWLRPSFIISSLWLQWVLGMMVETKKNKTQTAIDIFILPLRACRHVSLLSVPRWSECENGIRITQAPVMEQNFTNSTSRCVMQGQQKKPMQSAKELCFTNLWFHPSALCFWARHNNWYCRESLQFSHKQTRILDAER